MDLLELMLSAHLSGRMFLKVINQYVGFVDPGMTETDLSKLLKQISISFLFPSSIKDQFEKLREIRNKVVHNESHTFAIDDVVGILVEIRRLSGFLQVHETGWTLLDAFLLLLNVEVEPASNGSEFETFASYKEKYGKEGLAGKKILLVDRNQIYTFKRWNGTNVVCTDGKKNILVSNINRFSLL